MGFSINTVTLDGNLTRDPELRSLPSGTSVCQMRIAHNERYKDGQTGEWSDRANYFDITVWGGQGEWLAQNVEKGGKIVVRGRLRWREWQDKEGNNRQSVEVIADDVIPVERRNGGGGGSKASRSEQAAQERDQFSRGQGDFEPRAEDFAPAASGGGGSGGGPQPDDDIPF